MRFDELFLKETLQDIFIQGIMPSDTRFCVDARNVEKGDIFVAIAGMRHDGHEFVGQAIENGASGAIVSYSHKDTIMHLFEKKGWVEKLLVAVADPLDALINLAVAWRKLFSIPVVGITGSVGKTSAKETVALMLEKAHKKALVSHGNQNTLLGAALNILKLRDDHDVAVFEMGINRRSEMARIARLVRPTIGVITGIGHSHMEGLGSLQDIATEKRDIFKYFTENDIGIVNGDQELLSHVSFAHPVIRFGCKTTNQIQARKVRYVDGTVRCTLKVYKQKFDVVLPKPHVASIANAMIAAAVGHVLNLSMPMVIDAIQQPVIVPGRFEKKVMKKGRGVIINDCYNASPESMKAALLALQSMDARAQKVAVIGDMLELGVNSPFWHRQIGRFVRKIPSLKKVLLVGDLVQWTHKTLPLGIEVVRVKNWQEAQNTLPQVIGDQESVILVKGSLGVGLLNLVEYYT